jgi:UDP-N-acetylmuramoylalanine--D-glutamate ligase
MSTRSEQVKNYISEISNKKILVVGMGRSGRAAVCELHVLGAEVVAQDISPADKLDPKFITYLENEGIGSCLGREPEDIGSYDMIVLSPGVALDIPFVVEAREKGVEIIGELELAFRLSVGTYIAITGTNGKTTTTTLTGAIFEAAGIPSSVVGNIGVAVISKAVFAAEDEWLITETSSFQLETTYEFRPKVSAILNLTPDHLNRHKTMKAYGEAKARVFMNQDESDYLVINADDEDCFALAENCRAVIVPFSRKKELDLGAYLDGDMIVIKDESGIVRPVCSTKDLKIIGNHNVENALAAAAICYFAGIRTEVIGKAITDFGGVAHRLEYCGEVDGVKFYNDSKGTNVDATLIAMEALEKDIILIAGGDGKAQDFAPLAKAFDGKVKKLVLLGRDAPDIEKAARDAGFTEIYNEKDMNACVNKAVEIADRGDKVLLSPACASWDMYDNFEQRGNHFKDCVSLLLK